MRASRPYSYPARLLPGLGATRVDVKFTAFSLKVGVLPALSLPLDLFSPTGPLPADSSVQKSVATYGGFCTFGSTPQSIGTKTTVYAPCRTIFRCLHLRITFLQFNVIRQNILNSLC